MTTGQEKIITALRERRQIEEDVRAMLAAGTEAEFRQRARAIAAAGAAVIPAIVHNLDRADNRLLAALGTVASYVDHEAMARALRRAAQQPERSRQGRRGAVALLERFLGEEVGDELRAGLGSSEGPELAALDEVLERGPQNPALAAEYVQGLDQQDPDVVLTVVQVLAAEGPAERAVPAVELLRMIAQDVRGEIAAAALRALGARQEPEAAVALQTLLPATAPELRAVADRSLRKLQFRGVPVAPLPRPEPGWRALVSPVDGMGEQSVWLVMGHGLQARFLNVLIGDRAGAVQAAAHA